MFWKSAYSPVLPIIKVHGVFPRISLLDDNSFTLDHDYLSAIHLNNFTISSKFSWETYTCKKFSFSLLIRFNLMSGKFEIKNFNNCGLSSRNAMRWRILSPNTVWLFTSIPALTRTCKDFLRSTLQAFRHHLCDLMTVHAEDNFPLYIVVNK